MGNLAIPIAVLIFSVLLALVGGVWGRVLFLLCLGGVIALIGDVLGSKFGKKRLSILGLRPKHTALLFDALTGVSITLVTVLGVALISKPFRVALLNAEALLLKNEQMERTLELRRKERDHLSREAIQLTSQVFTLENKTRELNKKNEFLDSKVKSKEESFMVFPRGKPLLPQPFLFPMDINEEQLEQVLLRMVDEIRRLAKLKGVVLPKELADRTRLTEVVPIIYRDVQRLKSRFERRKQSGALQVIPSQGFVEARSEKNVAIGEQLRDVNFAVGANVRIFEKGEQIASITVDGTAPRSSILEQLFAFDQRVMYDLRLRGVSPYSVDVRSRQFTAGMMLEFVGLADLIERRKRRVDLELIATDDIFVYGPIDVQYLLARPRPKPEPESQEASPEDDPGN